MKVLRVFHAGRDHAHRERDRALARAGIELTLVVPEDWPGPAEITAEPFEIVQIPVRRAGDINRHTYDPDLLHPTIDRVRPDLIDIQAEPYSQAMRQLLRAAGPTTPVVGYTAQNLDKRYPPPYGVWEQQALRGLNGLYPCSRQAASVAAGKGFTGPIAVLPYAAPDAMTTGGQSHSDELQLLMVGRMEAYKGVADAVRLMSRLPATRLTLVGEGPELARAQRLARSLGAIDRLRTRPWLPTAELVECYQQAHIVLAPSRSTRTWVEQFGRMVVEAQACGAVVVGYASGALPEVVGDSGILVPEGDEDALVAAVDGLSRDRQQWSSLRAEGLARTRRWDDVAAAQITLYRAAIAEIGRSSARDGAFVGPRIGIRRRRAADAVWGEPAVVDGVRRPLALPALPTLRRATDHPERPLRVVFIDHVARMSGGEIALLRLIGSIPDIEPHVILAEDGPLVDALASAGISVEVLAMTTAARDLRRAEVGTGTAAAKAAIGAGWYAIRLAQRLRELEPDLVHANSLKSGYYGGVAARLAGVPMLWHVRDRIADDYLPGPAVRLTRQSIRRLAYAVVTNSRATLETLPALDRARVIGDAYEPPAAPAVAAPARPTIGIVGRLSAWKGQDVFLRATARLTKDHDDLGARVVGSALFGEDEVEATLLTLARALGIEDRVVFTGFSADVPAELARLSVLVHASTLAEPFGQVIIEGMAAGVPVVATRGGGASELVTDGVDGLLVTPGDDADLARAIDRLLTDDTLRRNLTSRARVRAADFSPSQIGPQMRAFYEELLNR